MSARHLIEQRSVKLV